MQLNIKATTVFQRNWEAINNHGVRFIRNEGGSRSSKTYSICQALILYCLQNGNKTVSIIRKTSPALMATVFRDFKEVMVDLGLWDDNSFSKVDRIYKFAANNSMIEFFSADVEQKLRGRKRDIGWINEANELFYDDFQQINLRTTDKIIVDYNPSEVDSYLYQLPADKTITIHSTYKDNPFLSTAIIEQIENYKNTDQDYYNIFALGLRAYSRENVYTRWKVLDSKPQQLNDWIYAIDYGYQHPTALVKIWYNKELTQVYVEEVIYESHLTSVDIINKMEAYQVDKTKPIISETARPEIIAEIRRAGYNVLEAHKDVRDGINCVKTFEVCLAHNAYNIQKENINYKYKKLNGVISEEVVKTWDDAMDAIRYGLMHIKKYLIGPGHSPIKVYTFNI